MVNAGRRVFNDLRFHSNGQRWPATPALALFVALFAPRAGVCEVVFGPVWVQAVREATARIVDDLGRAARAPRGSQKRERCYPSPDNKLLPMT